HHRAGDGLRRAAEDAHTRPGAARPRRRRCAGVRRHQARHLLPADPLGGARHPGPPGTGPGGVRGRAGGVPVGTRPRVKEEAMEQVLDGKVAIITGGGGGIGSVFGRELALRGASVVLADLNEDAATTRAADLAAKGLAVMGARLDATEPSSAAAVVDAAVRAYGGVDILVNCAALMAEIPFSPLSRFPLDWWDRVMAVNVKGPLVCAQAAVPAMRARGGGRIVSISSAGAFSRGGVYGVSKYALVSLTANLAAELGADGINVNAIAPGL